MSGQNLTLEDFGYKFNEMGQLRQIENEEAGFVFEAKPGNKNYNQRRYEALGEVITEEIYKLLETKAKLKKIFIPVDAKENEARGFFFASDDAWTADRLLVLIHGSGVVRAGQWSRKLIINEDINTGSQIPYILYAMDAGFGVVVLNTNQNRIDLPNGVAYIRGSEDPSAHALYVWDNFIENAKASHVAVVAHSAGGYVMVNLAHERFSENFANRVFAVAFTDSVHSPKKCSPSWEHMLKISRNWVPSRLALGEKDKQRLNDIERVSAATLSHEMTSASAFEDIKQFIKSKYQAVATGTTERQRDVLAKKLDLSDAACDEGDGGASICTPPTHVASIVEMGTNPNELKAESGGEAEISPDKAPETNGGMGEPASDSGIEDPVPKMVQYEDEINYQLENDKNEQLEKETVRTSEL